MTDESIALVSSLALTSTALVRHALLRLHTLQFLNFSSFSGIRRALGYMSCMLELVLSYRGHFRGCCLFQDVFS